MGDLATTSAYYSARPTVLLEELEDANLSVGLLSLMVEETTAGLYRCEAGFGNWGDVDGEVGFLYGDRRVFDFGRKLAFRLGDGDAAGRLFDGRITGLEGHYPQQRPPELVVLAEDRFQDLRMTRRSRTFEDVSDRDVLERIAAQHGLATEIDVDGPTYAVLAQVNQSDLAFLRERARAVDAELWMEGDTLHARARRRRKSDELTLTWGQRLREVSVLADVADQRTSLAVSGWDVGAKEGLDQEADEGALGGELEGPAGGVLLRQAFGRRAERLVHRVPLSSGEARALAEAEYRRMARRFVRVEGIAEGDARLRAGSHVILAGLSGLFDGRYYVTDVRHTFDLENGFRSAFCAERPWLGEGDAR